MRTWLSFYVYDSEKGDSMLPEKVRDFIKEKGLLARGDRVAVALSGGADSVCLLRILAGLSEEYGLTLSAVHVHHGLRGAEADRDADFCRELCAELKVPLKVIRRDVRAEAEESGLSLEEAGRNARREVLLSILREGYADKAALGHQKNDVAETVLHHLARGTGLAGMASLSARRGGLIRPLLCATRGEIEAYLSENGFAWIEDSTNREDAFTRNRIRNRILPELKASVNARAVEHIAEFSSLAGEIAGYLEELSGEAWETCAEESETDGKTEVFLKAGPGAELRPYLRSELIRRACAAAAGTRKDLSRVHCREAEELFDRPAGKRLSLPGGVCVLRTESGVRFFRAEAACGSLLPGEDPAESSEIPVPVPGELCVGDVLVRTFPEDPSDVPDFPRVPQKTWCKWIDYDKIKQIPALRKRRPGDYLFVTREGGRKTLSDYLTDRKIPRAERDEWLVLADGSEIIALPDGRLNERYKVTAETEKVLRIEMERLGK